MSNAFPCVETAKALHAKIALMTKSLEKTQTSIHEARWTTSLNSTFFNDYHIRS